jgi:hypothetical protein
MNVAVGSDSGWRDRWAFVSGCRGGTRAQNPGTGRAGDVRGHRERHRSQSNSQRGFCACLHPECRIEGEVALFARAWPLSASAQRRRCVAGHLAGRAGSRGRSRRLQLRSGGPACLRQRNSDAAHGAERLSRTDQPVVGAVCGSSGGYVRRQSEIFRRQGVCFGESSSAGFLP